MVHRPARSPSWTDAPTFGIARGELPVRIARATPADTVELCGSLAALLEPAIAIVGTRSLPARWLPRVRRCLLDIVGGLGRVVVSGGAFGVDTVAHEVALELGVPTCVVLASGLDRAGPVANRPLFQRALDAGGAVLSDKPRGARPYRGDYLDRNRIIASMADAVIVAACPVGSGAANTARHARELGVPVLALPGPFDEPCFAGNHELLRRGARVCVGPADVLAALGRPGLPLERSSGPPDAPANTLSAIARRVLEAVRRGVDTSRVADVEGIGAADLLVATTELDLVLGPHWSRSG